MSALGYVALQCNLLYRDPAMLIATQIQPVTAELRLDAPAFGVRAERLSQIAAAGVAIAPGLALSCDLIALIAGGDRDALNAAAAEVDRFFDAGDVLTLRGSVPDPSWGGPEKVSLIGASAEAGLVRSGVISEQQLIDFITEFGAVVHGLDSGMLTGPDAGDPPLAAALVAFEAHSDTPFPVRRADQIAALIAAFARAWSRPTARILRGAHGAPDDAGLALVVQRQDVSAPSVMVQSVDQKTGMVADSDADGALPGVEAMFAAAADLLRDAPAIEVGPWADGPVVIDIIPARRSRQAEVQIVVDLANRGVLSRDEALLRIEPRSLSEHIHPQIETGAERLVLGHGIAASPGAAQGPLVFSADAAQAADAQGRRAILVRAETSPEDIRGMNSAAGVLTLTGGLTSHAAVIAQGLGVPCVVGASRIQIDPDARVLVAQNGQRLGEGDVVTLDGSAGALLAGALPLQHSALSDAFRTLMDWSDATRKIGVRANADTIQEARTARRFRADGVGLCRTEHMFYDHDRLTVMRELIVADDNETRAKALHRLLPMQRSDFEALFEIMTDVPVTIRLLDPPLHEFLPKQTSGVAELAAATGMTVEVVSARIAALEEYNPMLGKRGVRLAVTFPEIYEMQARAIFEAADAVSVGTGAEIVPEIMIPLVSAVREVELVRDLIHGVARDVEVETGRAPKYKLGVMVETPRAALRAGDLALVSQFLSFGTNDLTQMTYGLSRDDAGRFMRDYVNADVFPEDPFLTLDVEGVGELLLTASQRGRAANSDLELGLCGEHGGDPASVRFCRLAGFDYVSCSPYRVPIARLAAAQAELLSDPDRALSNRPE